MSGQAADPIGLVRLKDIKHCNVILKLPNRYSIYNEKNDSIFIDGDKLKQDGYDCILQVDNCHNLLVKHEINKTNELVVQIEQA